MKTLNKLVVALIFTLSLNAYASTPKINSITLNDETVIESNEISRVHYFGSIKIIDYIELNSGSRIESIEIKNISYQNKFQGTSNKPGAQVLAGAKSGDGSGG